MTAIADDDACPCGSRLHYAGCCGRLHDGFVADSAEALMRSRYSAYALGRVDYLLATWHPRTRPPRDALIPNPATRWLGLTIRRHEVTGPDCAIVEFIARSKTGGASAMRLHETSRFEREGGIWRYVDGDVR